MIKEEELNSIKEEFEILAKKYDECSFIIIVQHIDGNFAIMGDGCSVCAKDKLDFIIEKNNLVHLDEIIESNEKIH